MAVLLVDDPDFIARLQAQEQSAFSQLVQHFHMRLQGFAAAIANTMLAEDIMQEAWLAIWKGLPGFEGRSSLTTWLYTIVRNECMGKLRKEGRIKTVHHNPGAESDESFDSWLESTFVKNGHWASGPGVWSINTPEAMLEEQQLLDCIEHNLESLQADQSAVFRLRELEQLPLEEICNILQFSQSNVRVLLHRARRKLLQVVDHYQETGEC